MAKERSPNYPGVGLDEAVRLARQLYDKEHRAAVPMEVASKALGYSVAASGRLSGLALQKLATLRQFGLVESAGKGKIKVSDRALDFVLHDSMAPQYQKAAHDAALAPPLFTELYGEYANASDNNLRAHLIKDRKFSEEGAGRLIKAFRDTISFAKVSESGYNGANDETAPKDQTNPKSSGVERSGAGGTRHSNEPLQERQREAGDVIYSWPLEDADKVEVSFVGNVGKKPTRRDLEALIDYLELIKKRTPAERDEPARLRELEAEEG